MNIKQRFILSLSLLILTGIYMPASSQSKDSTAKFRIKKTVPCQVTFARKLILGMDSNYIPIISVDEILKDPYVRVIGCGGYAMSSFEIVFGANGIIYKMVNTGNWLHENTLMMLRKIDDGSNVIIQDIHYTLQNDSTNSPRIIPSITFKVYQKKK